MIGVVYRGVARAYPINVLNYHGVVNDVIDTEAIAVTYCPFCATATVFLRYVDGKTTSLHHSGLLLESCMVMRDSQFRSLWVQPWGEL